MIFWFLPVSQSISIRKISRKSAPTARRHIRLCKRHLDASINQVAVLDALKNHNSEYLYFKTDHHWTADGAYYAYKELMKAKGMTPSPLTDFTKSEYPGFVGSFYQYSNQSETLKNNPGYGCCLHTDLQRSDLHQYRWTTGIGICSLRCNEVLRSQQISVLHLR